MSEQETIRETQTLGEFLKETRKTANLTLDEARESTKITLAILEAIEHDDFKKMPAEAFCRGFYVMYSNFLQLNPEIILSRYLEARGLPPASSARQSTPPVRKSEKFSTYAEPSNISPFMSSVFIFAALLTAITASCWYFNVNPMSFLNNTLDSPQATEAEQTNVNEPVLETLPSEPDNSEQDSPLPSSVNAEFEDLIAETEAETVVPGEEVDTPVPYHVEVTFQNSGILTATIDKGFFVDQQFQAGQTLQWEVKESILFDMPESIEATILMNDIEIPLPDAENGRRRLSLPEDLLN